MKFWEIGKRNLKEIYRNPVLLGFLLGMPVAFMLVFIAAAGGGQAEPIALSIVDEDHSQNSSAFIQYLGSTEAIQLNELQRGRPDDRSTTKTNNRGYRL
jgi:hypothetical protein